MNMNRRAFLTTTATVMTVIAGTAYEWEVVL